MIARLFAQNEALRDLVKTILENDPSEAVADNGMTLLEAWRDRAKRTLED